MQIIIVISNLSIIDTCKNASFILYRIWNKLVKDNANIQADDSDISQVTSTKLLGVIINDTLPWYYDMTVSYSKISKSIGIVRRVSYNLSTSVLLSLYYTMLHPC